MSCVIDYGQFKAIYVIEHRVLRGVPSGIIGESTLNIKSLNKD